MTDKHKEAIRRGLKLHRERRRRSLAMIESWKRRNNTNSTPQVCHTKTMNPHQRIAAICRRLNLNFTLEQLDDLVLLCEEYNIDEAHAYNALKNVDDARLGDQ
jgi:hypothetical protein